MAEKVDEFRSMAEQAKHFEGMANILKSDIASYAKDVFSERLFKNKTENFKLAGESSEVTFVAMDKGSALSYEELEQLVEEFGEGSVEEFTDDDYGSLRFDAKVLQENYDDVVEALKLLGPEVLERLFKPMLRKAKKDIYSKISDRAKNQGEFLRLMQLLRVTTFVK